MTQTVSIPGNETIGKSAERLLTRLATHGPANASLQDARALLANDLAVRRSDGCLEIAPAGTAHLARLAYQRSGAELDPFLAQHLGLTRGEIATADGHAAVSIDSTESPLAWLARRKGRDGRALIEPEQLLAGERLRADFTRAQLTPRVTANWSASGTQDRHAGVRTATFTEAMVAARQQLRQAFDTVGPEFVGLLLDVCCFLKGLEDVERDRGWPPRSAKVVLQIALDRLARHYGYGRQARGRASAELRTWLAPETAFVVGE
jgi:hypothetical protein